MTRWWHGEGSVYGDAANGTWVGAISLGGNWPEDVGFLHSSQGGGRLDG
jgi:hypothetical protein